MSQGSLATWEDVPVEVIGQILDHLDADSLLAMGKLNHFLNRVALAKLLGQSTINSIISHSTLHIRESPSNEFIPALCAALWIPGVSRICYTAIRCGFRAFLNDLYGLSVFISRMPPLSLKYLELSLLVWDEEEDKCFRDNRPAVTFKAWAKLLGGLLETALAKGCQTLDIGKGSLYPYFYEPGPIPTFRAPRNRALHWVQKTLAVRRFFPDKPRESCRHNLNNITIGTSDFLAHPVLPYITDIFQQSSQTLQTLEVQKIWSGVADHSWTSLFSSIHLPHLTSLTLAGSSSHTPTSHTLLAFLHRHPSISYLKLSLPAIGWQDRDIRPTIRHPLLPNLTTLHAGSQIVAWLLQSRPCTIPLAKWYPSLESVYILSIATNHPDIHFSTINKAILALNSLTPYKARDPVNVGTDKELSVRLVLQMSFCSDFWVEWMRASQHNSPLERSRISKLTLSVYPVTEFLPLTLDGGLVVARWLASFPMLEELEFVKAPCRRVSNNTTLRDEIMRRCRRLRTLKYAIPPNLCLSE